MIGIHEDYVVRVCVGVKLDKKEAFVLFSAFCAKYDDKLKEKCPGDDKPNTDKGNYCPHCGADLRYKIKVRDGIENLRDIKKLPIIGEFGLETIVLDNTENVFEESIILGKEVANIYTDIYTVGLYDLDLENVLTDVKEKISKLGLQRSVRTYFIATPV